MNDLFLPRQTLGRLLAPLGLMVAAVLCVGAEDRVRDDSRVVEDQVAEEAKASGPSSVRVSATANGRTPFLIGYNLGLYVPGSNVSQWLRYDEVNGARRWWPKEFWPALPAAWPAGESTLEQFEAARAELRANPAEGLAELEKAMKAEAGVLPEDNIGLDYPLSELKKNNIVPLLQVNHSLKVYKFDNKNGSPNWYGRWSYWRGTYLIAYYTITTYGVERFQLFNEPDHSLNESMNQAEYLQRLQIGSDALQAAFADVNRISPTKYSPRLGAPVTAGLLVFEKRTGRPDTRDVDTGWGELITRHRLDVFPGRSDSFESLYNVYAFQNYGRAPNRMIEGLPKLRSLISAANGGMELPVIVTEMNVSTAANLAKTRKTLNHPDYFAPMGVVSSAYVNAGIDEIYYFRHTQQPLPGGPPKKNGTHIVGLEDPIQNIVATTRGAEAARLFMRAFKASRVRLEAPEVTGGFLYAAACKDESDNTHYLLLSHTGQAPDTFPVDLSAWNLPPDSLVTQEEVSMAHHGDLRSAQALPADGKLTLSLPGASVTLVSVRPQFSGAGFNTLPVTTPSSPGLLTAAPLAEGSPTRVLLALRAKPVTAGGPLQVRGGDGAPVQTEVLGHIMPTKDSAERVVDITRYVLANPGKALIFQVVAEGTAETRAGDVPTAAMVTSAELRVYGPAMSTPEQ